MQHYKNINYYLIILIIISFPYMNFPFISSGTLKPLAIFTIILFFFYNIRLITKKNLLIFSILIFFLSLFSLFLCQTITEHYLANKPNRHLYIGTLQFFIFSIFSYFAYYIGHYYTTHKFSETKLYKFFLLAYYPSLLFGVIHTVSTFLDIQNPLFFLRDILATTQYPSNYYRNMMLTVEPSFAASDLMVIIFPISLILFFRKKTFFSIFTIALILINILSTKSGLGLIMLSLTIFILFIRYYKKIISILVLTLLLLSSLASTSYFHDRILSSYIKYKESGILEESIATRIVSYGVAKDIFLNHPWGVGYANEGYYYTEFIPSEYSKMSLFKDWADPDSKRFPDIKSTLLKLITSFGIIGLIIVIYIIYKIILLWKRAKFLYDSTLALSIKIFLANAFIMSFSINIIGYLPIFFLFGYYSALIKMAKSKYDTFIIAQTVK